MITKTKKGNAEIMPNFMRLGDMVYEKRKSLGAGEGRYFRSLSVRQAAIQCGCDAPTLSRLERGGAIDVITLKRVCIWLGISADDILGIKP
jgi:transcriptional regulator with XRE-family HTH domain